MIATSIAMTQIPQTGRNSSEANDVSMLTSAAITPTVLASTFPLKRARPESRRTTPRISWTQPHVFTFPVKTESVPGNRFERTTQATP